MANCYVVRKNHHYYVNDLNLQFKLQVHFIYLLQVIVILIAGNGLFEGHVQNEYKYIKNVFCTKNPFN